MTRLEIYRAARVLHAKWFNSMKVTYDDRSARWPERRLRAQSFAWL